MATSTSEKLKMIKEIMASSFMLATEASLAQGLQFKYTSEPFEHDEQKGWKVDILVKDPGYGERTIQQFLYQRPNNIDAKNMEYEVLVNVLSSLIQTSVLTWYQAAIMLSNDKELQKLIKNGKEDNINTDKRI